MVHFEVDHRERPSGIPEVLAKYPGVRVDVRMLAVGDYVVGGWVTIERKTTLDFVTSLVSGRLLNQMARLRRKANRPLLLIEGQNLFSTGHDVNPAALRGALISISSMWHVPILYSDSGRDTARVLMTIAHQIYKFDDKFWPGPLRRPKDPDRGKTALLQCMPGVGPAGARRLLERFGTIRNVISADSGQLQSVRGFGRGRAAALIDFWTKPYLLRSKNQA